MKFLTPPLMAGMLGSLILMSALSIPAAGQAQSAPGAEAPTPSEPSQEELDARDKEVLEKIETFGWTRSGQAQLGSIAQVAVPKGWRFTGPQGARKMLELSGNLARSEKLGMLTTEGFGPWVIFQFEETGYIKDDEKDKLSEGADAMLKSFQENQEADNVERKKMGMRALTIKGWAQPPRFNDQTKNLEWALLIGSEGGVESINYKTRLLGRHGVMEVGLVCGPSEMDTLLPQYQSIMNTFQYNSGNTYAEYRAGDKVAEYGLTALIAGGGAMAAAKMGLFAKLGGLMAKLGKGVIVLVVAIGAGLKALFTKLFCSKDPA